MEKIKIVLDAVYKEDISFLSNFYAEWLTGRSINLGNIGYGDGEHYKLLSYISGLVENELILDLGTADGMSALSLAVNGKNKVITYDLRGKPKDLLSFERLAPNLSFVTMSALDIPPEVFMASRIIFLDLDPHDGLKEIALTSILETIKWSGILIADDIERFDGMRAWWNGLTQKKYNITKYGHSSGTGIVDFGNQIDVVWPEIIV